MEKEYKFTKREEKVIKDYALGKIKSRDLGAILGVSHTRAIFIAGRYFIQEFRRGNLITIK